VNCTSQDGTEITASHALAECLRCGYRSTAIAILKRCVDLERAGRTGSAEWNSSLEELVAVCLDHTRFRQGDDVLATLDYAGALTKTDWIVGTLQHCSEPVVERLLVALTG